MIQSGELRLWQAALLQEIEIAHGAGLGIFRHGEQERETERAREWLLTGDDMPEIAERSGLNSDHVRQWCRRQAARGWPKISVSKKGRRA